MLSFRVTGLRTWTLADPISKVRKAYFTTANHDPRFVVAKFAFAVARTKFHAAGGIYALHH